MGVSPMEHDLEIEIKITNVQSHELRGSISGKCSYICVIHICICSK